MSNKQKSILTSFQNNVNSTTFCCITFIPVYLYILNYLLYWVYLDFIVCKDDEKKTYLAKRKGRSFYNILYFFWGFIFSQAEFSSFSLNITNLDLTKTHIKINLTQNEFLDRVNYYVKLLRTIYILSQGFRYLYRAVKGVLFFPHL